jgi:hypothetical protein
LHLLHGQSTGITDPSEASAFSAAAGARAGFDWPVSQTFSLRTHLDATVDLRPLHMQIGGRDAWVAPLIAVAAAAGVAVRFE